ncbi:UDP-N-acetylmuramoyl-tripeptide--D-alanyl-D-alanine ligase [Kordia algicida OT-1]|uniref:UDP-N-acetylmuramoyl-tripeptide--D-alanyl-D-alanine ligase n=1 Tax=Kordia algicida OT-1 TaxID=391587 RepID=A9DMD2_9FLAO|nr:UDP-N-acetylmuramoyl-tripeptide--D-alanyl-D-alanine ligase [Kordia algicida]EDP97679.1 UDP-N-acetylmuramoyl-tripeptide--D-alanyl-D-alanine ligase (UDP-N-acetylmuramoyl-L-alanyl-D-glutamyl-meso-2 [Kordia algicida OT-1]
MIQELYTIFQKYPNITTDSRKITPNCIFFALKGDNFNGNKYAKDALEKGAAYAIVDEKEYVTSEQTILVNDALESLQKLANYHRKQLNIPIISLTGSNGKTTTKELINAVLSKKFNTTATKGNLNNHIGVPLTLLSMNSDTEIGIVEMGANHKREIAFLSSIAEPDYGYITNFGKAHLEGFGGIEGVIIGKSELYDYLKASDKFIFVNGDDTKQVERTQDANTYVFGGSDTYDLSIEFLTANPMVSCAVDGKKIQSQLIGSYNFSNIAAAIAIGTYFKVNSDDIKEAIEAYIPSNNRSQILTKNTNKIILDAYNANPTSMKAALDNFSDLTDTSKIAFLGDMFELGDSAKEEHQFINDYAASLEIEKIYLIGENFGITNSTNEKIVIHSTFESLKENFPALENSTLLIKGSRGMALERILELL